MQKLELREKNSVLTVGEQRGIEGGSTIIRNKRTRWRCKSCTENAKRLGV